MAWCKIFMCFSLLLWLFYIYTSTHTHDLEAQLLLAFSADWYSHLNQLLMVHHSLLFPCFLAPELTISELIFRSEYKIKLHYLWCQALGISNSPLKNSKSHLTGWPPGRKLSMYSPSTGGPSTCSPFMAATHFPVVVKNTEKKTSQSCTSGRGEERALQGLLGLLCKWEEGKDRALACSLSSVPRQAERPWWKQAFITTS